METVNKLLDVMGGGWLSLGVLFAIGVFIIWLQAKEKKARRDRANAQTQAGRQNDQADTVSESQDVETDWDETQDEIDDIRNAAGSKSKKKRPRRE